MLTPRRGFKFRAGRKTVRSRPEVCYSWQVRHLRAFVLVLAGCATAAAPDDPSGIDATVHIDAPLLIDAPLPIDAPPPIDAAPMPDAPLGVSCDSANTCLAATALTSVSGDSGNQVVQASDYRSTWYSIRVTENDEDIFGVPMGIRVQLSSPPGSNFDLYVYVNKDSDVRSCTTPTASSTKAAGQLDSVLVTWGESGVFSNGDDDDRTVSIEVRAAAATTCDTAAPWQLTVYGNQ